MKKVFWFFFSKKNCFLPFLLFTPAEAAPLRVCADPALMPASNERLQGYENQLARIVAKDLHRDLVFVWVGEQRGFIRRYLQSGACDALMGVPPGTAGLATTRAYLSSGYAMVSRSQDRHRFSSFDAAWLRTARIGLPAIGLEGANIPPAMELARRGITGHITGFAVLGGDDPQRRMVDAVALGAIDVAFLWGPLAGYAARHWGRVLRVDILPAPAVYGIAVGVRAGDLALRNSIQAVLDHRAVEVSSVLQGLGVPEVSP